MAIPRRGHMILVAIAAAAPPIMLFSLLVSMPVSRMRNAGAIDAKSANGAAASTRSAAAPAGRGGQNIPLLRLEEAFWQSRLELSKKESVGLAVDLVDSTANVEIRGVPVRKCKIRSFKIGNGIKHLENQNRFLSKLSKPLLIQSETATLLKEPIRVEQAPRDSIEAMKAAARPFKPEIVDVYVTLSFGDDFVLVIRQLEKPSSKQAAREISHLRIKSNLRQARRALGALAHLNLPRHEHRIEIILTREDAKALYRALGKDTGCTFRL